MSDRCAGPTHASCCRAPHSFPIKSAKNSSVVNHAVKKLFVTHCSSILLKTPETDPESSTKLNPDACYDIYFTNDGPTPKNVGKYSLLFNNIFLLAYS